MAISGLSIVFMIIGGLVILSIASSIYFSNFNLHQKPPASMFNSNGVPLTVQWLDPKTNKPISMPITSNIKPSKANVMNPRARPCPDDWTPIGGGVNSKGPFITCQAPDDGQVHPCGTVLNFGIDGPKKPWVFKCGEQWANLEH
jgi:hypothetical protein